MKLLYANDRRGRYPESWYAATATPLDPFPPLDDAARADVCVIGAGYTGLSAALHLAEAGHSVVVLEAQRVGFGASGRNGGQVGSGQRIDQRALEARHGRDTARQLWDIGEEAKQLVRSLIARHRIAARWTPGVAAAVYRQRDLDEIHHYVDHMAMAYGYTDTEPLDRAGIAEATGSEAFAGGAIDWGAGHIHPLRFALGLAGAAAKAGVRIHEGTEALRIEPGARPRVETARGTVEADHLILAGNGYLGLLERKTAARVMPINNFILATEPLGTIAPEILPTDIAVADTRFVVNYWRKSEDGRLLFGGGESYGYRFPSDIAALVRRPMLRIYPQLHGARIDFAWGGTLAITMPRMPFIARPAPGIWSAAGYSGHGVAMATMAGRILAEAIGGATARYDALAGVPIPAFPGGLRLRAPLLALAMTWYALRDRLGL